MGESYWKRSRLLSKASRALTLIGFGLVGASAFANGVVCYYTEPNFRGSRFCQQAGQSTTNLQGSVWQDNISSILVRGDVQAYVCVDRSFRGACQTVTHSVRSMQWGWDNQISSASATYRDDYGSPYPDPGYPGYPGDPGRYGEACFFTGRDFRGASFCLGLGQEISNLNGSIYQDNISSIDVSRGVVVYACEDRDFGPPCTTFRFPERDLFFSRLDKRISSIRILSDY